MISVESVARRAVACVIKDNKLLPELIEKTKREYFVGTTQKLYDYCLEKFKKNQKVSVIKMKRETDIDVNSIINSDYMLVEFPEYIELLHKNYVENQMNLASERIRQLTTQGLEIEELKAKAQEIIFEVTLDKEAQKDESLLETSLMKSYENMIEGLENEENKGLSTGIPSLDARMGGLWKGHLILLAGSTSMGKTALALKITQNLIKARKKVGFISLEMNDSELTDRLITMDSRVNSSDFNNRTLSKIQLKNLNEAYNRYCNYEKNLMISYKRGLNVDEIKARCRRYYQQMNGLDLLVIDYLQRIKMPGKNTNKEVAMVANDLRDLAGELDVPILVLSQLNRNSKEGRPRLYHLRDSGELEESADEVLFVYREMYNEEVGEQEQKPIQEAEIIQAKGRTSGVGTIPMMWYSDIQLWQDAYLYYNHNQKIEVVY